MLEVRGLDIRDAMFLGLFCDIPDHLCGLFVRRRNTKQRRICRYAKYGFVDAVAFRQSPPARRQVDHVENVKVFRTVALTCVGHCKRVVRRRKGRNHHSCRDQLGHGNTVRSACPHHSAGVQLGPDVAYDARLDLVVVVGTVRDKPRHRLAGSVEPAVTS